MAQGCLNLMLIWIEIVKINIHATISVFACVAAGKRLEVKGLGVWYLRAASVNLSGF